MHTNTGHHVHWWPPDLQPLRMAISYRHSWTIETSGTCEQVVFLYFEAVSRSKREVSTEHLPQLFSNTAKFIVCLSNTIKYSSSLQVFKLQAELNTSACFYGYENGFNAKEKVISDNGMLLPTSFSVA